MKRTLAIATTVALGFGAVACSDAEEAAKDAGAAVSEAATDATDKVSEVATDATDKASEVATDATDKASEVATDATDKASDVASDAKDAVEGDKELVDVDTAAGESVKVPSGLKDAIEDGKDSMGELQNVSEGPDHTYLATLEEGNMLVWNGEKAVPVVGKIGETWLNDGGLESQVGAPVSAEETTDKGWTQEFKHGTINWTADDAGVFSPEIVTK
ncbi:hypothetical protein [Corynebacterium pseudopelargi]|nr:hypothetical protein [Corynebacterium pseudopelargi]